MADWVDSTNNQKVVREGQIRMASIEFGANKELCKSLGIKRLPTVHFYRRGEKLAGFPCGPAKFQLLLDTIQHYLSSQKSESDLEHKLDEGNALMNGSYGNRNSNNVDQQQQQQKQSHEGASSLSHEQQLAQAYGNDVVGSAMEAPEETAPEKKRSWWRRG